MDIIFIYDSIFTSLLHHKKNEDSKNKSKCFSIEHHRKKHCHRKSSFPIEKKEKKISLVFG